MADLDSIRAQLESGERRAALVEVVQHGLNLPAHVKALAYVAIQSLPENELEKLGALALDVLGAVENQDMVRLESLLKNNSVPPQFIGLIKTYAANLALK